MTLGTLVAFMAYIVSFYDPMRRLTEVDNTFQQAIAAADRIFELLISRRTSRMRQAPYRWSRSGARSSSKMCISDTASGEEVLHDVDFRMAPGEVVALVGPSGAGKTSIANLVCRFYDPTHGHLTLDGHDLRNLEVRSLRQHVAVVLQDTFLFNMSVRENLLYGKPDATERSSSLRPKPPMPMISSWRCRRDTTPRSASAREAQRRTATTDRLARAHAGQPAHPHPR